jgi:hypothetical protein
MNIDLNFQPDDNPPHRKRLPMPLLTIRVSAYYHFQTVPITGVHRIHYYYAYHLKLFQ